MDTLARQVERTSDSAGDAGAHADGELHWPHTVRYLRWPGRSYAPVRHVRVRGLVGSAGVLIHQRLHLPTGRVAVHQGIPFGWDGPPRTARQPCARNGERAMSTAASTLGAEQGTRSI